MSITENNTQKENNNQQKTWKLKINIPFKRKIKRLNTKTNMTIYIDFPIDLETKDLCRLIEDKIKETNKQQRNLFVIFGNRKNILHPKTRPAFIQEKYAETHGYDKNDVLKTQAKTELTRLDFFFKRIKNEKSFCKCDAAEGVDLSYIKRPDFFIDPPKAFKGFKEVYLNGNSLLKIPEDLLNKNILCVLDLCGNNIETKQLGLLTGFISLKELCLNNNQLESLSSNFFQEFQHLKMLSLDNNKIKTLDDNISLMKSLKILSINENRLKYLPSTIKELKELQSLSAQFNLIETIPDALLSMDSLKFLNMKDNFLSINNFLIKTKKIIKIDLSKNKKNSSIEDGHDTKNKKGNYVDSFHKNQTLTNKNNSLIIKDYLLELKELFLPGCEISYLPSELFEKIPNIEVLDICKNNLFQLPQSIDNLSKLRIFNAHGNSIRLITFKFSKMHCLRSLDLHSNNITVISGDIWNCPLLFLNLSDNNLSEFPSFTGPSSNTEKNVLFENKTKQLKKEKKICSCFSSKDFDTKEIKKKTILNFKTKQTGITPNTIFVSNRELRGPFLSTNTSCIKNKINQNITNYKQYIEYKPKKHLKKIENNKLIDTLSFLNISQNKLTTKGIRSIRNLSSLVWLNLSINQIRDVSKLFPSLKNLVFFSASNNHLFYFPKELKQAKNLKILLLSCNDITTIPSDRVKPLLNLRVFDISYNNWNHKANTYDDEWNWNQTPSLFVLNIEGNTSLTLPSNLYSGMPEFIRRKKIFSLPFLCYLNVENTQIPEDSLPFQREGLCIKNTGTSINGTSIFSASSFKQFGIELNITIYEISSRLFVGKEIFNIFALFQSHGKENIAKKLHRIFPSILQEELSANFEKKIEEILEDVFIKMEIQIKEIIPKCKDACSVIAVICHKNKIHIANTGVNSIYLYKEEHCRCITEKQSWKNKTERERTKKFFKETCLMKPIYKKTFSRAFGIFQYPEIISTPKIQTINRKAEDHFLVIGTYYFWKKISHVSLFTFLKNNPLSIASKKIRDYQTNVLLEPSAAIFIDLKKTMPLLKETNLLRKRTNSLLETSETRSIINLTREIIAPTGTVAMAVTDIKHSSELWSTHPQLMHAVTALHNDLMRRILRFLGGYEVKKEGDSFFATFPLTELAIKWCTMAQTQLLKLELPSVFYKTTDGFPIYEYEGSLVELTDVCSEDKKKNSVLLHRGLSVRMGIHTANPICDFDPVTKRTDYLGPDVIKTHRICSEANGGQIAISKEVYDVLCGLSQNTLLQLGNPCVFFSGTRKLKGLDDLEEIYIVYPEELASRSKYSEYPLCSVSLAQDDLSLNLSNLSFEEGGN